MKKVLLEWKLIFKKVLMCGEKFLFLMILEKIYIKKYIDNLIKYLLLCLLIDKLELFNK